MTDKKAQGRKIKNFSLLSSKKGQEEMVGFALIIIIVAVILLIFLSISLKSPNKGQDSYRANSFVQAYQQYTTTCSIKELEYLSIKDLISECIKEETCLNEEKACDILEETSKEILEKSWVVENGSLIQGYSLRIISNVETSNEEEILFIEKGNSTNNYQGGSQKYPKGGKNIGIFFNAYF